MNIFIAFITGSLLLFASAIKLSEFETAQLILYDVAKEWQTVTSKVDKNEWVLKADENCDVEAFNDLERVDYIKRVKDEESIHVGQARDGYKGLTLLYQDDSFWCGTNKCVKSELMFVMRCFIKKYA